MHYVRLFSSCLFGDSFVFCSFQLNLNLILTVRGMSELEMYVVGVERIKEYTELPNEVGIICVILWSILWSDIATAFCNVTITN